MNYLSNEGRAIIFDSKIDSWTIQMNNLSKKINNKFDNKYNLTGCLTIIDSLLNNVNISGKGFNCEDTINLIRSSGSIMNINIQNSNSDAFDADFSDLKIKNLNINNSKNDCVDFSYGIYSIENLNLKECGDKGISVGEKSNVKIFNIKVNNSNIGIASKDSSYVYVDNAEMDNLNNCLSAYNKKQEFNIAFLKVKKLSCTNSKKKLNLEKNSIIIVENEF